MSPRPIRGPGLTWRRTGLRQAALADGAGRLGGGLDDREGSPHATQQQAEFEIQPTQKFNL